MYFGLCNSPPTFQRLMDMSFADLVLLLWLVIYMDDTTIHTKGSIEHHRSCVLKFLQRCRELNLFLRIDKCEFEQTSTDFLSVTISENSVMMNQGKTKAIRNWIAPKKKKDLQSFL